MKYYNPNFKLNSTTNLQTGGYYEIKQIFGTYTTDGTNFKVNRPKHGFLQFFKDGFCKVGYWNGIYENPVDVKNGFLDYKGYIFNGIYKIDSDTIKVEYLYNPISPGLGYSEHRNMLIATIKNNRLIITSDNYTVFSYPKNPADSLTSSCIGKFVSIDVIENQHNNYLKENIERYLKTEE
jgi:hypothetical protein